MTASRLAIRASDWASGLARWPAMNRSLLPSAVASPWQTVEFAADLVVAAGGLALDVVAMTKAPPPATVAALSSRASFFFGPRLLLRDMRASNGSGERTPLCTRYRTPLLNGRPKSRKWPASQGC